MRYCVDVKNKKGQAYMRQVILDAYEAEGRPKPHSTNFHPVAGMEGFVETWGEFSRYARVNRRIEYRLKRNGYKYQIHRIVTLVKCLECGGEFHWYPEKDESFFEVGSVKNGLDEQPVSVVLEAASTVPAELDEKPLRGFKLRFKTLPPVNSKGEETNWWVQDPQGFFPRNRFGNKVLFDPVFLQDICIAATGDGGGQRLIEALQLLQKTKDAKGRSFLGEKMGWCYAVYYHCGHDQVQERRIAVPLSPPLTARVGERIDGHAICHWGIDQGWFELYNADVKDREKGNYPEGHWLISSDGRILMNSNGIAGNPVYYYRNVSA